MLKKIFHLLLISLFLNTTAFAKVLFIHNYNINEFVIGTKTTEVAICYSDGNKYMDERTKLTDSFMKRWFGKEKEMRKTTHILLDKDIIREIDYEQNRIVDFPLKNITDPNWYNKYTPKDIPNDVVKMLDKKYAVLPPLFEIKISPTKIKIDNYLCEHITINLRLETIDKSKNASSITLIKQEMWLTDEVAGFDEYQKFNEKIGKRLGIDPVRFGVLENLINYLQGSLEPIKKHIKNLKGYPIKKETEIIAIYTTNMNTSISKTTKTQISKTTMILKQAIKNKINLSRFMPNSSFITIVAKDKK